MGKYTLIDNNIQMLTKKIMDLEYNYNGIIPKSKIEKRLREYTKTKKNHKEIGLNEAEYFMVSGYVSALEWVLSGEKKDTSLQKANLYTVEHKA